MLRARNGRRRGNAFIEAAFVLVPLFAILFAIIGFGFAVFFNNTFIDAVL